MPRASVNTTSSLHLCSIFYLPWRHNFSIDGDKNNPSGAENTPGGTEEKHVGADNKPVDAIGTDNKLSSEPAAKKCTFRVSSGHDTYEYTVVSHFYNSCYINALTTHNNL